MNKTPEANVSNLTIVFSFALPYPIPHTHCKRKSNVIDVDTMMRFVCRKTMWSLRWKQLNTIDRRSRREGPLIFCDDLKRSHWITQMRWHSIYSITLAFDLCDRRDGRNLNAIDCRSQRPRAVATAPLIFAVIRRCARGIRCCVLVVRGAQRRPQGWKTAPMPRVESKSDCEF